MPTPPSHNPPYFIHPPRLTIVFITSSPSTADLLRHCHNWLGRVSGVSSVTEADPLPSCIRTPCIRELNDGNLLIDHEVANGERLAADMRSLLIRKGRWFLRADLRFVGRMVRARQKGEVVSQEWVDRVGGDGKEVDVWSDDGLDGAKGEMDAREKDTVDVGRGEKDGLDEPITAES